MKIEQKWINEDHIFDKIPVFSTFSNLVDLFQKYHFKGITETKYPLYTRYIEQKKTWKCLLLLIPIIGNIVVALAELREARREKQYLDTIDDPMKDPFQDWDYNVCPEEFKTSRSIAQAYVKADYKNLKWVPVYLKDDEEFVLQAIRDRITSFKENEPIRQYYSQRLEKDPAFQAKVRNLCLIEDVDSAIDIPEQFTNDREVCLAVVKRYPTAIFRVSDQLRDDKAFILEILKNIDEQNRDTKLETIHYILKHIGKSLRNDPDFIYEIIQIDPRFFNYASNELLNNKVFVLKCLPYKIPVHWINKDLKNDPEVKEAIAYEQSR